MDALIGAGGMGQVYRATDTKLKRAVAIKVPPEALASDADRLARFQREAEVLASLNHPNIAQIYGLEEAAGTSAIVMELVEGPTLADRMASGPLPLAEALPVAKQCADALEAAHEQGIVHRDFKPANIKLRPDEVVKVLDFGLAKAMEPVAAVAAGYSQAATITTPAMTRAGVILGTAAYMSPEQARGKPADKRADIWAFGCVLAEMLAGHQTFTAVDPRGSLIVQFSDRDNVLLERVPFSGGEGQRLSFPDVRLAPMPFTSNAVRADGAIIKNISASDSWLWSPVILFPDTGKVQRVPLPSFLDAHHVSWSPDGRVLVFGLQTHSSIWRLRPASGN